MRSSIAFVPTMLQDIQSFLYMHKPMQKLFHINYREQAKLEWMFLLCDVNYRYLHKFFCIQ